MKFRECVTRKEDLRLYVGEKPNKARIKLDLTANPLGCPKGVLSSLRNLDERIVSHYSEPPELPELKRAIARHSGVFEEQIMITSGADQAIEIVFAHILESGDVLGIQIPTFPRFEIVARRLCNAKIKLFEEASKIPKGCKAVVFCTPNNPTTKEIDIKELENAAKKHKDKFIIIDSAFSDFGNNDVSSLIRLKNVIILKSLSKSFGLAGIRIGWIESQKENIINLRKGVSAFRVPFICQIAGLEALKDGAHLEKTKRFLKKEMTFIRSCLGDRVFQETLLPFFLLKTKDSVKFRKDLLSNGISVVDGSSFKGLDKGFARVAVGTHRENIEFIREVNKI